MTIIELLNKSLEEKDFSYVEEALYVLTGVRQKVKNKQIKKNKIEFKTNKHKAEDSFNSFVDDLSLHAELVEKNKKPPKKNNRPQFVNNCIDVNCSKCGLKESINKEELSMLSKLSEGTYKYSCAKCLKRNVSI